MDKKYEPAGFLRSGYCERGYHHPHLHCVVPGGGLSPDGNRWISCRPGFFLSVRVLSRRFRRLFLKYLEEAFDSGQLQFFGSIQKLRDAREFRSSIAPLKQSEWCVYAKAPFAGPQQVLNYVGRYTHRVAISNNRLIDIEDGRVSFYWKDYRDHDRRKIMTLPAEEFIRRFLIHVLPEGFPTHPLLWLSQQLSPRRKTEALPPVIGNASARP